MEWVTSRVDEMKTLLQQLLAAQELRFDDSLRSRLPESHGVYAISLRGMPPEEVLRAGRTKTARDGLRQRIYQNHFMGDQAGNLRSQLVQNGQCKDLDDAKKWIRENCVVRFFIIPDDQIRQWGEHFILSILRPKYGD